MDHILKIQHPPQTVPTTMLPDGAVTGNGDLSITWGGTTDRIRLYIGKNDFWKGDGSGNTVIRGGIVPLGLIEILLPHFAYAPYHVEQDMDKAVLKGYYDIGTHDAVLTAVVCATENTILLELDRSFPGVSSSVALLSIEGNDAVIETGEMGDIKFGLRGFDTPSLEFPTYGFCALREISRVRYEHRERIRWAVCVETNHDSAAYRRHVMTRISCMDNFDFETLLTRHDDWWKDFWSKSTVSLPEPELEMHWYAGLYIMACCARNQKFPPGLWGNFVTSDGMGWFGDYHLNYNYEAPFYALASSNHAELTDCYMAPLMDFIPKGKIYAKEYLGCRGIYYPVGIGPLGMETDIRPQTKEHGHLFLGQKSNAVYAAVIPMMRWYSTRDTVYAREQAYPYLREVADFWEDYLVFRDGRYHILNDALNEVEWWSGPDHMPKGQDEINPIISVGMVRMLMNLLADMAAALSTDTDRIPHWLEIAENLGPARTTDMDGVPVLRGTDNAPEIRGLCLQYMYPAEQIGKYKTPELFEAAQNTLEKLAAWDDNNLFCSFYPAAARLEYPAEAIIENIKKCIKKHGLPNGMFRYQGGGIENSAAIPATINEMLLQSYEHIIRLFPTWDRSKNASFRNLRAYGAFLVSAWLEDGQITAEIYSEKGENLNIEKPGDGYFVRYRDQTIPLDNLITSLDTSPGERVWITV